MTIRTLQRGSSAQSSSLNHGYRGQLRLVVAIAGVLFVLAGCGDTDSATLQPSDTTTTQNTTVQDNTTVPQPQGGGDEATDTTSPTEDADGVIEPVLEDVPSPVGGTVKQVTIPGPETSVLVVCDQAGFEPFFFTDQGNWVGCSIMDGVEPGPESALAQAAMSDVASPVGGTVKQVTIPGPETSVLVVCDQAGFEPFFFTDQGNWVGCQRSP